MKAKVLLASAASLVCGLTHAEVVVYGMGMPFLDEAETTGATTGAPSDKPSMVKASDYTGATDPKRTRMTVGTSHLGFRGSEELSTDLKVVWQMESAFQIDQNTGPGWGARDSKVGLSHKVFGEINMGQWDSPYKYIALPTNPIRGGYAFDRNTLIANPGFGVPGTTTQFGRVNGKPDAAFDRRMGNSVQYWSPVWAGLSFRLDWQVNEGKGNPVAGGPTINPNIFAADLQYDWHTLSLRYAYERHNDFFGMSQIGGSPGATNANPGSKDEGHKFVVLWLIGNTRLTGTFERLKYHNDDSLSGAVNEYSRNAFYAVVEQRFGGGVWSLWGAYGRADDGSCSRVGGASCSTHALGADFWNAGAIYRFSKRTEGFLFYYRVNTKESSTYTISTVVGNPITPGADTVGYGLGLQHFF